MPPLEWPLMLLWARMLPIDARLLRIFPDRGMLSISNYDDHEMFCQLPNQESCRTINTYELRKHVFVFYLIKDMRLCLQVSYIRIYCDKLSAAGIIAYLDESGNDLKVCSQFFHDTQFFSLHLHWAIFLYLFHRKLQVLFWYHDFQSSFFILVYISIFSLLNFFHQDYHCFFISVLWSLFQFVIL